MTIFEAYNSTKQKLLKAGIDDYVFEAKQIIKHITGLTSSQILVKYNTPLTDYQQTQLTAIIRQREIHYPLQYIFGEWSFYGNRFYVGPGVLVPRADTETLIEPCIEYLKQHKNAKVLDLCTGSGCIGITLAKEVPDAEVKMLEKYKEAAVYTQKNIKLNGTDNAEVFNGDIFAGDLADGEYDLLVSNPPYIPKGEMKTISPETEYEPKTALLGGEDGLDFYRAIIKNYKNSIKQSGFIAFEVGIGEFSDVSDILSGEGFKDIKVYKDMNGIERAVTAVK